MRLGASSSVVEKLSCTLLKSVLSNPRQASVECKVQSSAMELLRGNLKEARVGGTNWTTPAGMTMRSIDLTLNGFSISPQAVLRGAISFRCPAKGRAVLKLTSEDFANFLVHPLLTSAPLASGSFEFLKDYSAVDPAAGVIYFSGLWHGQHVILQASQPQRFGTIFVKVADAPRLTQQGVDTLNAELSEFFNTVVLDMDGTQLRFADMNVSYDAVTGEPVVGVTVNIEVHRVPNPSNLRF